MARLLWLILSAAGDTDVGPDVTLAHADGSRPEGEALRETLAGATLVAAEGGFYSWQLLADGTLWMATGREHKSLSKGSWRVDGNHYCRTLSAANAQESCFSVSVSGAKIKFFDEDGLMRFDAVAERP
jgi:hypothetical protein